MENDVLLTEQEMCKEKILFEDVRKNGGMTTDELIKRLSAIPYDTFQNNIKTKIANYK
jgi:hypothetical protein